MTIKRICLFLFFLLLLSIAVTWSYLNYFKQEAPVFSTVTVTRTDLEETVLATGTLHAYKTVDVGAQVSGQLKRLHVQLGDQVKEGDLLAEIDPVLQQNALKEAQAEQDNVSAQIHGKQARLAQYQKDYRRQKKLIEVDATSRVEFEDAFAQFEATQAELDALRAQLEKAIVAVDSAQANLGYTRISAPMDGVILSIDSDEGQTLVSSQTASTILTLADVRKMTVKAEISEADVTKVKAGQSVYFTILGEPDHRYHAELRAIEPGPTEDTSSSSSSSGTAVYYNGLFDVDNTDSRLRVGMTTEVTIILHQARQVLVAPVAVLREINHEDVTQVDVLKDGRPVPRTVHLGLNDNVHVQLTTGVSEGEKLIIHSLPTADDSNNNTRSGPFGGGPPPGGRR